MTVAAHRISSVYIHGGRRRCIRRCRWIRDVTAGGVCLHENSCVFLIEVYIILKMNRKQLIALMLFRRRMNRRRKNRLIWVHPINEMRKAVGTFYTLFKQLRQDDTKFFNYFRMSITSFDELHGRIKDSIQRKNTKMRNCIQPVEILAITLR